MAGAQRQKNQKVHAWLLQAGSLVYLCLLFYLVFFARRRRGPHHFRDHINLAPFSKIREFYSSYGLDFSAQHYSFWEDFLGNILLFIPFPLALQVFLAPIKTRYLVCLTLATSVCIECCQYLFNVGTMDVDDIILNTAGGITGIIVRSFFVQMHNHATTPLNNKL